MWKKTVSKNEIKLGKAIKLFIKSINDKFNKNFSIVENTVKGKSMLGFITRTSIKVLVHNISFFINKLIGNYDSIAKIKRLVFG